MDYINFNRGCCPVKTRRTTSQISDIELKTSRWVTTIKDRAPGQPPSKAKPQDCFSLQPILITVWEGWRQVEDLATVLCVILNQIKYTVRNYMCLEMIDKEGLSPVRALPLDSFIAHFQWLRLSSPRWRWGCGARWWWTVWAPSGTKWSSSLAHWSSGCSGRTRPESWFCIGEECENGPNSRPGLKNKKRRVLLQDGRHQKFSQKKKWINLILKKEYSLTRDFSLTPWFILLIEVYTRNKEEKNEKEHDWLDELAHVMKHWAKLTNPNRK